VKIRWKHQGRTNKSIDQRAPRGGVLFILLFISPLQKNKEIGGWKILCQWLPKKS
jgi:hypothetical protein